MFRRKVQIFDLSTAGISLEVTFNVLPSTWPSLQTPYASTAGSREKDELLIFSPRFRLVSDAKKWLADITAEVKKLYILDQSLTDLFKTLEGEVII